LLRRSVEIITIRIFCGGLLWCRDNGVVERSELESERKAKKGRKKGGRKRDEKQEKRYTQQARVIIRSD